jgi:UDP-N-acetylglucosamine transferase subunit ALG13
MILVTLGTQDKPFERLLKAIQKQIDNGTIKDRVVVQAGCTKFKSENMEIFDLIDRENFSSLISECDLLFTHGGVGSIINGLNNQKKIIACPRLEKYGEHTNDHQLEIIEKFSDTGLILPLYDFDALGDVIESAKDFEPKKYVSNTANMVSLIESYIDNN